MKTRCKQWIVAGGVAALAGVLWVWPVAAQDRGATPGPAQPAVTPTPANRPEGARGTGEPGPGGRRGLIERRLGGGGGGGENREMDREISPEQLDRLLVVLREYHPELAQRIEAARKENPEQLRTILRRHWPTVSGIARLEWLQKTDPELYELRSSDYRLDRQTRELSAQVRKATTEDDTETARRLTSDLRNVVQKHFEVRQEIRERELKRLEQRLAEMRQQLESRQAAKDQLIEQRMKELTGEPEKAEW